MAPVSLRRPAEVAAGAGEEEAVVEVGVVHRRRQMVGEVAGLQPALVAVAERLRAF